MIFKLDIDLNNYFERGKHVNEFQNKFNYPLYVPMLSKLNDSCGYMVEFISTTENYYERGEYGCRSFHGTKTLLYMLKVLKLLLFYLPILVTLFFVNLFVYKITIHRKWVRLKCVLICFLMLLLLHFLSS